MQVPERLLAPTDFSEASNYAVEYAVQLARRLGAKVDLLHVYTMPLFPDGVPTVGMLERIVRAAEHSLSQLASHHDPELLGRRMLRSGDARDLIVEVSDQLGIDLIVMGTHGKRGLRRVLLGSVTEAVLRSAPCPVLAVREPTKHSGQSRSMTP